MNELHLSKILENGSTLPRPPTPEDTSRALAQIEAADPTELESRFGGVTQFLKTPKDLPESQAVIFTNTVRAMRPGFFVAADEPLLRSYAFAAVLLRKLERLLVGPEDLVYINRFEEYKLHPYFTAYRQQLSIVQTLLVRMRMTPNAREDPAKKMLRQSRGATTAEAFLGGEGNSQVADNPAGNWRERLQMN